MDDHLTRNQAEGLRYAREIETHLGWLDGFTSTALGVLATASGIYTYLGVSTLLDDTGTLSVFAAISYSVAVSVGIFVFWSYMMRLVPAVRTLGARLGLGFAMLLGSGAIVAMSSWLNAAALAGAAAVEQHLARTVQEYQVSLEKAHSLALSAQGLERDVARVRQSFEDLSGQEAAGDLSGFAGRGAVFRVLRQKSDELIALERQIAEQAPAVEAAFAEGNAILKRMRELTVSVGPVEQRSVEFSEETVRLAGSITQLRQLSVAPLVQRAAADLADSVVLPEVDSRTEVGAGQTATITSVLSLLKTRAETLGAAAAEVASAPPPADIAYTPISAADAVILYAENFVPAWAGAIAIDLLPAVLVLIVAIAQAAIRSGRVSVGRGEALTLAELRDALVALREADLRLPSGEEAAPPRPEATVKPLKSGQA
jgi:hypothetical protein